MEDRELLLDYVRHGSSRAFTALVERHVNLVYSAALRRVGGDPHRAADVTQQVFTDLASKAARLTHHPILVGWLHQSTRWAANRLCRSERRRTFHKAAVARSADLVISAERPTDWEALRPVLDTALDELRDAEREAVLLRYFSNLSYAEISARLGLGENAARMRVDRALDRLYEILKRRGITSTSIAVGIALSHQAVAAAPAGLAATLAPASLNALAAVAASGSGVSALATFIAGKVQIALVFIVAAILTATLYQERTRIAAERQKIAQTRPQREAAQHRFDQAKLRLASEIRALQALPAGEPVAALDPVDVERKRLDLVIRKGELDSGYAALFRRVHLAPPVLDQLKELIVQRNQAEFDAQQVAKAYGEDLTPSELRQVRAEADRPIDQQIAALLGPEKMAEFNRYLTVSDLEIPREMLMDPARDAQVAAIAASYEKSFPPGAGVIAEDDRLARIRSLRTVAAQYLTTEEWEYFDNNERVIAAANVMNEIARSAALQGKLRLSKQSAKYYPSAPAAPSSKRR